MRAIVVHAFGEPPDVGVVPDPAPPADGVVVAVRATGVCRSDWHGWMGHDPAISLPHVPGHELAGEIAAVGPEVRGFQVGDRVTLYWALEHSFVIERPTQADNGAPAERLGEIEAVGETAASRKET